MSKSSSTVYMVSEETGYRYRRYPESKHRNGRVYWVRTKPGGGARYFHVDLWELHNGPVPPKFHIHHADHDPMNNAIENLTCISPTEHAEHHMNNLSEDRLRGMRENMDRV
ncbi:MAG: HNH endonuclease, partial [Acidobacteria bacterium]|nr:HNH endonuclease [Acidobacteriota bacterium]